MIEAKTLSRSFSYNGVKLPDSDPRMTAEEVKSLYSHQYPELATAAITRPEASGERCSTASSERLERRGKFRNRHCIDNVRTSSYTQCAYK
jgi:PRTRC genetic system protein C